MTTALTVLQLLLLMGLMLPAGWARVAGLVKKTADSYCLTPSCVLASSEVIKMMNATADPCEDFYEFACGNFLEETVIPDHKTRVGTFSVLRDKLNERLRTLFESDKKGPEPKIFDSVRNFFSSCMDQADIAEHGKADMLSLISELGGWPLLMGEAFNEDEFVWQKLSVKADSMGFGTGTVMDAGISTNSLNASRRIIAFDQASLGLSREYLIKGLDEKEVKAYYSYMVNTAVYFGADREIAEKELQESLNFELKLAEMSLPREERRNKTALTNQMTLREVSDLYEYNWVNHMNDLFNSEETVFTGDEVVNVKVPSYLTQLNAYIKTVPRRVVANYMIWRYIKSSMGSLDEEAIKIVLDYSKVITGKETIPPRWETCVRSVSGTDGGSLYFYEGSLTNGVGAMYAKKYFPANKKAVADEMVQNIRKEFKLMLDELDWMDADTLARAHTKVDKMSAHIAYAKEILDDQLLNEFYEGLVLDSNSYLRNKLALRKFINQYYVKEFAKPIDKQSWKTHGGAAIVNAFYSSSENSIQFPAGILEGLFFQSDRPSYMNYGAIGMVVGHEITHGFDDQGSQKDGDGNLVNWWEKVTKERYNAKAKCIIDQYSEFSVNIDGEDLSVNGINTQGENIADNGGFKEAYRAYQRLVAQYGEEPLLPGLAYTPNQMFWLSGAAVWCGKSRPASEKNRVLTDPHSPSQFRVVGSFRNLPEFARDWNCPSKSPMNPEKKCTVW